MASHRRLWLGTLAGLLLTAAGLPAQQRAAVDLKSLGPKVVFLGDSNTFAGLWVAYLDGYLRTRFPDRHYVLINLGLPSETCSGLSEPDHPYPRPDVHERLDRALARTRPDTVVICYGMNDGTYSPFSEERFAKYKQGIESVVRRAEKAGAKVVLMTPAPFDPTPLKDKVVPATAEKFSWLRPYEKYDDVLAQYSQWLLGWREKGYAVADPHGRIHRFLAAVRKDEPGYVLSGDGIHPNPTGHALIALELLRTLHAPAEVARLDSDIAEMFKVEGIRFHRNRWTTPLPMPLDPRWDARLLRLEDVSDRFNHYRLRVTGLDPGVYELSESKTKLLGTATAAALREGVDLTKFRDLSTNRRSAELGQLAQKHERLLGLAWLTDVGHKRPDTPKGLPLAEAQKQAEVLDRQMRELAEPREIDLQVQFKKQ